MGKLRKILVVVFCAMMMNASAGNQKSEQNCNGKPKKDCSYKKDKKCDKQKGDTKDCPLKKRNPMDRPDITPEQREKFEKWMNFDSLSVDEQCALLRERKAEIDERDSIRKARKAELDAKWADFDNLSIEEQKKLLDMKGHIPFMEKKKHKVRP